MSDPLTAAQQALPGLEWTEIGPEVRAYIGRQLVYLTDRGSDGVFVYAGPDSHRWMPTIDEAAQWLRAQVESRRNALDAALGDSQWARVAELEKAVAQWVGMRGVAAARADAAEAKLKALAGLVERWPERKCPTWCNDLRCVCGAEDHNLARAEARRLLLEVKPTVAAPAIKTGRECPNCDSDEVFSDGDEQFEGTLHQCEQCGKWASIAVDAGRYALVDAPEVSP